MTTSAELPDDIAALDGNGRAWRELQPGLHLGLTALDLNAPLRVCGRTFPAICLTVVLDGYAVDDGGEVPSGFCPDELWLSSTGHVQATAMTIRHERPVRVVELLLTEQWIEDQERAHATDPAIVAMRRAIEGPVVVRRRKLDATLRDLCWTLLRPVAHGFAAETQLRIDALRLLQVIINRFAAEQEAASTEALPPRQLERLVDVRRQIDSAPGRFAVAALAREHGLSESALRRSFRAAFGQSLRDYVLERRMLTGRNAILRDGMSVAQAAWLAGYDHPPNFTAAFKRHFGYAPARLKPGRSDGAENHK